MFIPYTFMQILQRVRTRHTNPLCHKLFSFSGGPTCCQVEIFISALLCKVFLSSPLASTFSEEGLCFWPIPFLPFFSFYVLSSCLLHFMISTKFLPYLSLSHHHFYTSSACMCMES